MVQIAPISEHLTLKVLRDRFGLTYTDDPTFFPEWRDLLPPLTTSEQALCDRLRQRYRYYLDEDLLLEESIKLMLLSPILEIVGFFDAPFRTRFEPVVSIEVALDGNEPTTYRGRMDTLVVQDQLWVLVIESKQTRFSVETGLAQVLAYMLGNPNPDYPVFGLIVNGSDFLFLKLARGEHNWQYGQSHKLTVAQAGDLEQAIAILKGLPVKVAEFNSNGG